VPELEVVTEVAVALATPASAEEGVLFIGTQFSNLSTAVDTSAAAACNGVCVFFFLFLEASHERFLWKPTKHLQRVVRGHFGRVAFRFELERTTNEVQFGGFSFDFS